MAIVPRIAALGWLSCALTLLLGAPGCNKDKQQAQSAAPTGEAVNAVIPPPSAVLAYIGLKNPRQAVDDLLALTSEIYPLPLQREGVLDLLAQQAHLPRGMLEALDTAGTFWMVLLESKKLSEQDPGVLVLPIRSRQEFAAALGKKMRPAKKPAASDGGLTRYEPRPGEVGLQPLLLEVGERFVLAPSSAPALAAVESFVRKNLLQRALQDTLTVHLRVAPLLSGPARELDSKVDRALKRLRSDLHQGKGYDEPVASVAQDSLREYTELLRAARELVLTASVGRQLLTLAVRGEANPQGKLHQLLKRQQVGEPFGVALLPQDSWLVLTNLSNPAAFKQRRQQWDVPLIRSFNRLAPPRRGRLQQALAALGQSLTGDVSLALHKGAQGSGLACSAVSRVQNAPAARQALHQLAVALEEWLAAEQGRSEGSGVEDEISLVKRPFAHAGSQGELVALSFVLPPDRRRAFSLLLGPNLTFGWALTEDQAFFVAGKDAQLQLERMAAGAAAGKLARSLKDNPAFVEALGANPGRVGLLYLSLVDLARWFEGTGIPEAEAIAAAVRAHQVSSAPSADWGVNQERSQFDVALHLPLQHFTPFKPLLEEFIQQLSPDLLGP